MFDNCWSKNFKSKQDMDDDYDYSENELQNEKETYKESKDKKSMAADGILSLNWLIVLEESVGSEEFL